MSRSNHLSSRPLWQRIITTVALSAAGLLPVTLVSAAGPAAEKSELKFGFIKLTDMAPLAVAYE
ncbi:MAG TPA: hypothetical protein PKO17_07680, partial [Pseudomonadales bacterium]|nr:hypothetical protein [Pseudomonadales bacterium]